ncbi:YkgJ family cysteine cluster protein [bacterium]|nr:YkgJ family cysteine cluster protein [bacterium]
MLQNYEKYLTMLNEKLERFFAKQEPYIFCKKGCSKCCKNAQYPFSKIEFDYIMEGFGKADKYTQDKILKNIKEIKYAQFKTKEKPFTYKCPFLIENECKVYEYRGIICRTFGLINIDKEGGTDIPFCALEGLNYSNVYDKEKHMISSEMYKKLNILQEPLAYNVQYEFLTDEDFGKGFGFQFGEIKPLIDWFE